MQSRVWKLQALENSSLRPVCSRVRLRWERLTVTLPMRGHSYSEVKVTGLFYPVPGLQALIILCQHHPMVNFGPKLCRYSSQPPTFEVL